MIGAPLVFTLPLFMFTRQLYRVKRRALDRYHEKAVEYALAFEQKWLRSRATDKSAGMGETYPSLNNLNAVYEHIHKIRVVPFDMRSFVELMMQTLGSLLPLFPYLEVSEPILKLMQRLVKAVGH